MSQIQIIDLYKYFITDGLTTQVLREINLKIREGESLSIQGPSGSGKSTLLYILGTLEKPTSGEVFYGADELFSLGEVSQCHFRNQTLGFVFQFHHLLPDLTVLENVSLPLWIRGMKRSQASDQAKEVLTKVGLSLKFESHPNQLSGGEQQRVALARAVVGLPRLILADEPTGNLDRENGNKVFDLLLKLNEELKATLVMVTHNEELAKQLKRQVHLIDGKIQE